MATEPLLSPWKLCKEEGNLRGRLEESRRALAPDPDRPLLPVIGDRCLRYLPSVIEQQKLRSGIRLEDDGEVLWKYVNLGGESRVGPGLENCIDKKG